MELSEVKEKLASAVAYLHKKGFSEVYLTGSMAKKGYSYHDIDLYVKPFPESQEEREKLEDELMSIFVLPFNIREPRPGEEVIKLG